MVRFTLIEVNLDGAQFDARAPFSGTDLKAAKDDVEASLQERIERGTESPNSDSSLLRLVTGLVAVAVVAVAARKLRSGRGGDAAEPGSEEPIVAD